MLVVNGSLVDPDPEIDQQVYRSPIVWKKPNLLSRIFSLAKARDPRKEGIRMESGMDRVLTQLVNDRFDDSGVNAGRVELETAHESNLFALLRRDGKWDIFDDISTCEYDYPGEKTTFKEQWHEIHRIDKSVSTESALEVVKRKDRETAEENEKARTQNQIVLRKSHLGGLQEYRVKREYIGRGEPAGHAYGRYPRPDKVA